MKHRYVFAILFFMLLIIVPTKVNASRICNYVGQITSGIKSIAVDDPINYMNITVKIDDILAETTVTGLENVANAYDMFENGCIDKIYFCGTAEFQLGYGIHRLDDSRACNLYISAALKGSSGGGGYKPGGEDPSDREMSCATLFGDPNNSNDIAYWMQWTLDTMKYIGIIALFVLSTVDFIKALVQNDQDALKKAGKTAAKRFVLCVLLFFLPIIVDFFMSLLGAYGTCNFG